MHLTKRCDFRYILFLLIKFEVYIHIRTSWKCENQRYKHRKLIHFRRLQTFPMYRKRTKEPKKQKSCWLELLKTD